MPVDPNIPLAYNPVPTGPDLGTITQNANALMQLRQRRQQAVQQNALAKLLSNPSSVGSDGSLTPEAIRGVMQISPQAGMQVIGQQAKMQNERSLTDSRKTEAAIKKQEYLHDTILDPAYNAYSEALAEGKSPDAARQIGQDAYTAGADTARKSGLYSEDEQRNFPTQFDPVRVRAQAMKTKDWLAAQRADKGQDRADAREARSERHEDTMEGLAERREAREEGGGGEKGWTPMQRPDGSMVRVNASTGEVKPFDADTKGLAKPGAKSSTGGLTDEGANYAAETYRRTGRLPPGVGASAAADRERIISLAAAGAKAEGGGADTDVATAATTKANTSSLANLTKMTDAATSFETTAGKNFDTALKLAPRAIPTNMGPWINAWVEKGETAVGNPDVPPYVAALLTGANEYAKIMSGSTGSQGSTVDSRREAAAMFSPSMTFDQISRVVDVAKQDMENRRASLNEQLGDIKGRLGGGGAEGPPTPASHGVSAVSPGTGRNKVIRYDAEGNRQ